MAESMTQKRLVNAFVAYQEEAQRNGIDTSRWQLHQGSRENGLAWRSVTREDFRGTIGTDSSGYLGSTKREAYATLATMTRMMAQLRRMDRD